MKNNHGDTEIKRLSSPERKDVMLYEEELTEKIIGAAIEVHRALGPGLLINFNVAVLKNGIVCRVL